MKDCWLENITNEMSNRLDALIKKGIITASKKIVLFGLGESSVLAKRLLDGKKIPVYGYVDNNKSLVIKKNREIKNYSVRYGRNQTDLTVKISLPEDMLVPYDENIVVFVSSYHAEDMIRQTESYGYRNNKNIFCLYDASKMTDFKFFVKDKKKLSLSEMKAVETGILQDIDRYCQEHNLRYWVDAGTLLGTIRHGGFIPWDDDIDIVMPWNDYNIFISEYQGSDRYGIDSPLRSDWSDMDIQFSRVYDRRTLVREAVWPQNRIEGLYIDVFPLIGTPDDPKERTLFLTEYYEHFDKGNNEVYEKCGDQQVHKEYYERSKRFLNRYEFDKSKVIAMVPSIYRARHCYNQSWYAKTMRKKFEAIDVNVPEGYEEVLYMLYGVGWKEIPKNKKSKHIIEAYWR